MPTYEYECESCGHHFEVFQSMKDDKLTDCPQEDCDGHVRRLLGTGAGIIFKGSGFYETDYRSDSYKKGAKADQGSGSSSSGGESKSDSGSSSGGETKKSDGGSKPDSSSGTKAKAPA